MPNMPMGGIADIYMPKISAWVIGGMNDWVQTRADLKSEDSH